MAGGRRTFELSASLRRHSVSHAGAAFAPASLLWEGVRRWPLGRRLLATKWSSDPASLRGDDPSEAVSTYSRDSCVIGGARETEPREKTWPTCRKRSDT